MGHQPEVARRQKWRHRLWCHERVVASRGVVVALPTAGPTFQLSAEALGASAAMVAAAVAVAARLICLTTLTQLPCQVVVAAAAARAPSQRALQRHCPRYQTDNHRQHCLGLPEPTRSHQAMQQRRGRVGRPIAPTQPAAPKRHRRHASTTPLQQGQRLTVPQAATRSRLDRCPFRMALEQQPQHVLDVQPKVRHQQ